MICNPVISGGGSTETVTGILESGRGNVEVQYSDGHQYKSEYGNISINVLKGSIIRMTSDGGGFSVLPGGISKTHSSDLFFVTSDFTAQSK